MTTVCFPGLVLGVDVWFCFLFDLEDCFGIAADVLSKSFYYLFVHGFILL